MNEAELVMDRARRDPIWFCKELLNVELEIWQVEMLEAVADLDRIQRGEPTKFNHKGRKRFTIVSCHRTGKTFWICIVMLWFQFTRRGRIPLTAIKEATITRRTLPTLSEILRHAEQIMRDIVHVDYKHVYFFGDKTHNIIGETATNPDALAGSHHANLMYVVDEASSIPDPTFAVISGALAGKNAILIMIANPTRTEGFFYQSHHDPRTEHYYYRKAIKHHETSRVSMDWVKEMRVRYGVNSPIYKIRALGEFAESSENQLLNLNWLNAARGVLPTPPNHPHMLISADVAGGGIDSSIVVVAHKFTNSIQLHKMYQFNFPEETAVADLRIALTRIWADHGGDPARGDYLVVDSIGIGDGVSSELVKAEYPVVRYKGGSKSDNPNTWRNRRVQSYLCMRDALRDKHIFIDPDFCNDDEWLELESQAASIRTDPGTERYEDLELKSRMIARGVKSPDYVDAISMLYATQVPHNTGSPADIEIIGEIDHIDEAW